MVFLGVIDNEYASIKGECELLVCTCTAAAGLPSNLSPLHAEETRGREQRAKARLPTSCNGESHSQQQTSTLSTLQWMENGW